MYPGGGEQCSNGRIVQRRAPSGRPSRSPVPSERPCKPSGRNVRQQSMRASSERAQALKQSATQSTPRNRLLWLAGLGLGCHGPYGPGLLAPWRRLCHTRPSTVCQMRHTPLSYSHLSCNVARC